LLEKLIWYSSFLYEKKEWISISKEFALALFTGLIMK
jgi:hypothetical protein